MLRSALLDCGLVAILRGVRPSEVSGIAEVLYAQGFRVIEVPLNSPQAAESIQKLRDTLPKDCLIGAGTVLTGAQVNEVRDAGGKLIVMPHSDKSVIDAAISAGLEVLPGVATPNEAFAPLASGITLLKVFPADHLGPAALRAWLAVLPPGIGLIPVGGVTPQNLGEFIAAGAIGFGVGSALYKPGMTAADVASRATQFVAAWHHTNPSRQQVAP
jgi:2-dehydro-3-deoxyphosphogalactonate aldolase